MSEDVEKEEVISTLHHSLRASRRRYTIQVLGNTDSTTLPTREIARQITSVEQDVPPQQATGEPYRNVYNSLTQTHLPTLARAGVIVYDPMRQQVSAGPNFTLALLLDGITRPAIDILQEQKSRDSVEER